MAHRVIVLLAVLLTGLWFNQVSAAQPFNMEKFEALQHDGKVVLIDVFANWCPTCAKQNEILADYRNARPDSKLHILKVDFDRQKKWVRHFRAPRQSTLILYRGDELIWFSVAETRKDVIFEQLDEATGVH